jgi:hypothetical protein
VKRRYGVFSAAEPNAQDPPPFGAPVFEFPYSLQFANAAVEADVELHLADQRQGGFLKKIGYIHIIDAEAGDLWYPASAGVDADDSMNQADDAADDEPADDNEAPEVESDADADAQAPATQPAAPSEE